MILTHNNNNDNNNNIKYWNDRSKGKLGLNERNWNYANSGIEEIHRKIIMNIQIAMHANGQCHIYETLIIRSNKQF